MRKVTAIAVAASALLLSGCYHAVIDTGRAPNGTTVERAWAHGFLWGLVPPSVTETAQKCPGGVAKVETKHSFLNGLAGVVTYGLYAPMTIIASCTGAKSTADATVINAAPGKAAEAIQQAAEISKARSVPVFVQF
ncbi:Bor family protein [Gemmatimonas sp.]|uniref:Bor family protein n=1 Tax=Gemmatimonas sp. TaxID=1962908 RepID=UPI003341822E